MSWENCSSNEKHALIGQHLFGQIIEWHDEKPCIVGEEPLPLGSFVIEGGTIEQTDKGLWTIVGGTPVPAYFTISLAESCVVEQEIARRHLQGRYISELAQCTGAILDTDDSPSARALWTLVTASADQRCHAALRACGLDL